MDFEKSQTYANIKKASEFELMSSTRYRIYADTARQEEFMQIGNVFDTTARNELEHARIWLRRLNNGVLPSTQENLKYSIGTEMIMANEMYREYAKVAREEGFDDIAALFNGIANIEYNHDSEFQVISDNMENNQVFCKEEETLWICMACGNILSGDCAPQICPVCGLPQGYYQVFVNYNIYL